MRGLRTQSGAERLKRAWTEIRHLAYPPLPFGLPLDFMQRRASSVTRLPLVVVASTAILATAVLLPISGKPLGPSVSFVPALISIVACFDVMSVYLLVGDFRDRGDVRLLVMACAYSWSLTVMAGYALAFPGAVTAHPPLAFTPSMAPYFYIAWHGGFPLLLGAAWAPWPPRWTRPTPLPRRNVLATALVSGAAAAGIAIVVGLAVNAQRLPVLINGLDTSRMASLTAPLTIPLVALALAATVFGTARRTGPERWSSVAVLVCLLDLILTYYSRNRFSLGWYAGRSLTILAAGVVLVAMLASFRRLKAQAEHDAVFDALTGLLNRRGAYTSLDQLIARARRTGSPLGVVSFDLDFFKQVNDLYGHEAGDVILADLGRLMTTSSRRGDVIARVGGEEFLVILPDTDLDGTGIVAERIRALIAAMPVPVGHKQVTVSLGATALEENDLDVAMMLRRADRGLYQAKENGRNQVVNLDSLEAARHRTSAGAQSTAAPNPAAERTSHTVTATTERTR